MDRIFDWARARGFETMELCTAPALNDAVRLYERYGFARQSQVTTDGDSACDLHFSLRLRNASG